MEKQSDGRNAALGGAVHIPQDLLIKLKIEAAKKQTSIKALVTQYCSEGLKSDRKTA